MTRKGNSPLLALSIPFGVMAPVSKLNSNWYTGPLIALVLFTLLGLPVLVKLASDLWNDENYSHGLLIPFVAAFILWRERGRLLSAAGEPERAVGIGVVAAGLLLLLGGTVGAELFTQRIALIITIAGLVIYFFGRRILLPLTLPFALLLLAIPIPQIIFNRISFPLQLLASRIAVWLIRSAEVPTLRKGNIIDILPRGSTQTISLEVVEACSGIRSLMTLVTLALVLGYLTRRREKGHLEFGMFSGADLLRTLVLMAAAVPVAVITNAVRVAATGIGAYFYGIAATEGTIHEVSGVAVFVAALGLIVGLNWILKRFISFGAKPEAADSASRSRPLSPVPVLTIAVVLLTGTAIVNWFSFRAELTPPRAPLAQMPAALGDWRQRGDDFKFDAGVESILRTTDYVMREYSLPDGRIANIYVGYYATQRTGATYHSPQNCLPGAGWVLSSPEPVEIVTPAGRRFTANRYIVENGIYREVMIYWYQGRGRTAASEYVDKLNTVLDSVTRRRSDGAIVRVMTDVGSDEAASLAAASDLAARLADELPPFVPN
ncbi:MAG: EpsI family protein [Chloracidobacterium sp.]|nr:EpsI family protein [Chloracidobacterium sp.]MCO5333859.1 EpsI family protein [Pyrinomonadaceae bacterium]